jgi:hypothetical protein
MDQEVRVSEGYRELHQGEQETQVVLIKVKNQGPGLWGSSISKS